MTGLALWLKEPVKRLWLANQTSSHVQAARELMKKQDWSEASRLLMEAMRLAPDDAEVLRTFADLLKRAKANPSDQIQLLQRLVDRGLATPVDMTDLAGAHLRRGDIAAARSTLDGLPPSSRSSAEARMIEAAMLRQQGRKSEAEAILRQVLESQAASDPEARFKLAVLDFKQPHTTMHDRGVRVLWELAHASGPHTDEAIRLLAALPNLKPASAAELATLAEPRSESVRRTALIPLLRLHPEKRDSIFREEHARSVSNGEAGVVSFARWLVMLGQNERVMEFLPDETLVKLHDLPVELLRVKLTALARSDQWEKVRALLTPAHEKQLGTAAYHLWLARLHGNEPDGGDRARQHLRIAGEASGNRTDNSLLLEAISVAAQLQDWSFAASLCQSAAEDAATTPARLTLLEQAHQFHTNARDCASMLRSAREIAALTPGNQKNAFRADYFALLAGESFEVISARLSAAMMQDADEDAARRRLLQALTAYRLGSPVSQEALVKDIPKAQSWPPGHRAVFAALLALSGQNAAAFQLSERIPSSSLLPEEARLMRLAR